MVSFRSASILLFFFLFAVIVVNSKPIIKSGYSKNHHLYKRRYPLKNDAELDFWTGLYTFLVSADSFYGG
ncbi:unnamed protein product [Caenorhabditis bovis]|uniref:Uncharacterized protein n=1 Tax=Caenorhabditis bovis TaxID=2654633 RepID=A0A8S1EJ64_9PELO|nr:unnamed protein product [Caenorhabditis bovis]